MNGILLLGLIVAGLALLGAVAMRFGVDSRIDVTDPHGANRTILS